MLTLYYWKSSNGHFHIQINPKKKFDESKDIYNLAAESRRYWIEQGIREGNNNRYKRKIESIHKVVTDFNKRVVTTLWTKDKNK